MTRINNQEIIAQQVTPRFIGYPTYVRCFAHNIGEGLCRRRWLGSFLWCIFRYYKKNTLIDIVNTKNSQQRYRLTVLIK